MTDTVALIIPTYNRVDLLKEAIDSVLKQTRVPDEIIVVDDGSTDSTWDHLQLYSPPVIPLRLKANQGRSLARNTGLEHATASLICFLDSDDLLTPQSIEARAAYLETHPGTGLAIGHIRNVQLGGYPYAERNLSIRQPIRPSFTRIARYNTVPVHSYMLRRDYLPEPPHFRNHSEPFEDWDFLLRILAQEPRTHLLDVTVGYYRQHDGMTVSPDSGFTEPILGVQNMVYTMKAFRSLPGAQQARIRCSHAVERMSAGYEEGARQSLLGSFEIAPWYIVAYPLWLLSWIAPSAPKKLVGLLNSRTAKLVRD